MNVQIVKCQSASDDEISKVEADLKLSFPPDYREFVSKYDGATPEENVFENDVNVSVDRFIPISEIERRASGVEGLPPDALPIAEAPSGNFIYLRKSDFSVWFWDHEIESGDKKTSIILRWLHAKADAIRYRIDSAPARPSEISLG